MYITGSQPAGDFQPYRWAAITSAEPAVTFPAEERHRPSAGSILYCMVTEAHRCEQLAQDCYVEADWPRLEPATVWVASERSTVTSHRPHILSIA